ncbi:MAG: NADH:ubiquinone reductase (Na(+)-transporting) subunit C [Crocinitomicaceae bacterium]|nr:NADH:ubiquinone reductase (Na(+)-transporting) subunit C [Crocinitomicaceae bacterium]
MKFDKNSNSYTFIFAIVLVVVVGIALSAVAIGLKPYQDANAIIKKKMDILGALSIECTRENANEMYDKYILVDECKVLNTQGQEVEGEAFDLDIQKEFRDQTIKPEDRKFPLYVASVDGEKRYVLPMVGKGLWGPIWGYMAIKADKSSIFGAKFDHKGETPGLGAEITQAFFYSQFESESISEGGVYKQIKIVKDGSGTQPFRVDGITGGTITSKGVEEMLDRTLQVYVKYFATLN